MSTIKNFRNYLPLLGVIITFVFMHVWMNGDYFRLESDGGMFGYILLVNPILFGFVSVLLNALKYKDNEKYSESNFAILMQFAFCFCALIIMGIGVTLSLMYCAYLAIAEYFIMLMIYLKEKFGKYKVFKIAAIILVSLLVLHIVVFLSARHGWRLFGFDMCESPNTLPVEKVYVTDETVHIVGETTNSTTSYVGNIYKVEDNVLYIGIKHNLMLGFYNRLGGYSFVLTDDFENIDSIYLVGKGDKKCIWTLEKDKKYMDKIKKVRLYETVWVSSDSDYKEKMKTAEFVYADDDLLERIKHPTFSNELYLTKGMYLGVAELESGEELLLKFNCNNDWYGIIGETGHYDY